MSDLLKESVIALDARLQSIRGDDSDELTSLDKNNIGLTHIGLALTGKDNNRYVDAATLALMDSLKQKMDSLKQNPDELIGIVRGVIGRALVQGALYERMAIEREKEE